MKDIVSTLLAHQAQFAKVVPFDPTKDGLLQMDFSSGNKELNQDVLNDVRSLSEYVNRKLHDSNSLYGIGGYAEHREVYSKSRVFDAKSPGEEPRRLHLGIDIWGKPHTVVMVPLDGIVHSFGYHDEPGNYGATIILTHRLTDVTFYTLYGHLSFNSIKNLQEGERMIKGDSFAEFGIPAENGHWPPHLHFQVIKNLEDWNGDYPGVCKISEKEKYLNNCPDPDLILQMMQFAKK